MGKGIGLMLQVLVIMSGAILYVTYYYFLTVGFIYFESL